MKIRQLLAATVLAAVAVAPASVAVAAFTASHVTGHVSRVADPPPSTTSATRVDPYGFFD